MTEENDVEVIEAGAPEDIGDDLAEMLGGIVGEAESLDTWRRAESPPRKYEFLDNLPLDDFSLAVIAGRFGGGDYQIRAKGSDGKYIKSTTRTFRIGGPPRDPARDALPLEDTPAAPDQFAVLAELMRDVAAELRARHAEPQAGGDPMAMALELSKAMREAASEAAAQVRDLMGGDAGGRSPDALDMVERVMDLQERFGGGGGGGTDPMINALGRELLTVFKNAREGESGQDAGAVAAPTTGQPGPKQSGSPPAANPNQPAWVTMLAPWMPDLIGLAVRGREPGTYANVIQDQLSDRALDVLASVIAGPDFADMFYLHFPDTLQHRQWFDELLAALAEDLTEGEVHAIDPEVSPATETVAETEPGNEPGPPSDLRG